MKTNGMAPAVGDRITWVMPSALNRSTALLAWANNEPTLAAESGTLNATSSATAMPLARRWGLMTPSENLWYVELSISSMPTLAPVEKYFWVKRLSIQTP